VTELDAYSEQMVGIIRANCHDEPLTARLVRQLTRESLGQGAFLLACAERIVSSIETSRRVWRNPPLLNLNDPPVVIRVFYWPAGRENTPHLHNAWTVTGVLHNEIVVETFRDAKTVPDAATPAEPATIVARAGETGYLLPPCVHRLRNLSQTDSATFHVFSKEEPHENVAVDSSHGALGGLTPGSAGVRRSALRVVIGLLTRARGQSAVDLLQRIFALADAPVRLQVVKALLSLDIRLAYEKSRELEATLQGRDKEALSRINAALAAA